jgi:hypothetical protein
VDFLTAEVAKAAQTKSLKFLLHKRLSGREPARSIRRIHASAVTKSDFCGRFYALSDLVNHQQKDEWLTTSENVTFHLGRVLQDSVVNWLADAGVAVGHWRCLSCKWTHIFCKRPICCEKCGVKTFQPIEVTFKSKISGIGGSFDCLVNIGEPKLRLVEIKTLDKDMFKTLKEPQTEHRLRTKLYLRLAAEATDSPWVERVDTNAALVLYVSKGGYGVQDFDLAEMGLNDKFSPFKEFIIERDDVATQVVSDKGRYVTDWRKGTGQLPPKICADPLAKEAKWCPLRSVCWSDAFDAKTPPKFIEEDAA